MLFNPILNLVESWLRYFVIFLTNFLPCKVIRDDKGRPFLHRYHLFSWGPDGPGICFHHFIASDPERGYHDHPWIKSCSFILCGGYQERILDLTDPHKKRFFLKERKRWQFNKLDGINTFHRVVLPENGDAWTIFVFHKRAKTWGMYNLEGEYYAMSHQIKDLDGGWWETAKPGKSIHSQLPLKGKVVTTVDTILISPSDKKVLLIKRGKNPYQGKWSFPGGRVEESDATLRTAAQRELREETNLSEIPLKYHSTVGNQTRDPRGFYTTHVFVAAIDDIEKVKPKAGDDAVDYQWFSWKNLPEMAFDHQEIFQKFLDDFF